MGTKTRPTYVLFTRDSHQTQGHIQTASEGMEEGITCKWKSKESWCSNSQPDKIKFKIKIVTRDKGQ